MFITVTASNGESAKVMLWKCQRSPSSSTSNLPCSKQELLSLTHQPNFETFYPNFSSVVLSSNLQTDTNTPGGTPLFGLYGDVPLDRLWFFGLAVLNRVTIYLASVLNKVSCPKQGIVFRAERLKPRLRAVSFFS